VVPTGGSSAAISVLLGNGDGTFGNPIVYASNLLSIYSTSIAVADFNGDGKLDLALTDSAGPTNAVAIVLGNGDGTFQSLPPSVTALVCCPQGLSAWTQTATQTRLGGCRWLWCCVVFLPDDASSIEETELSRTPSPFLSYSFVLGRYR